MACSQENVSDGELDSPAGERRRLEDRLEVPREEAVKDTFYRSGGPVSKELDSVIASQHDVGRFARRHGLLYDAATHVLDLVSEVGELAKLILEASDYGEGAIDDRVDFSGEMGDAFYSLLTLASVLDVDAGEALQAALRKYETRLRETGEAGSS